MIKKKVQLNWICFCKNEQLRFASSLPFSLSSPFSLVPSVSMPADSTRRFRRAGRKKKPGGFVRKQSLVEYVDDEDNVSLMLWALFHLLYPWRALDNYFFFKKKRNMDALSAAIFFGPFLLGQIQCRVSVLQLAHVTQKIFHL